MINLASGLFPIFLGLIAVFVGAGKYSAGMEAEKYQQFVDRKGKAIIAIGAVMILLGNAKMFL